MNEETKCYENYAMIAQFLLEEACKLPETAVMEYNFKKDVGHYVNLEIAHKRGYKPMVRIYDCPDVHGHSPQQNFYEGDTMDVIKKKIYSDRPTMEFVRNLSIGWKRYGIKDRILQRLSIATAEAEERLEAEKGIDDFEV